MKNKVVPFERPAAYWAVRARRHRAPDSRGDKARLLRKALEKSGDPALALELCGIYGEMDCYTAAEKCLFHAALNGGITGEVCFQIACCAFNRGDEALAEAALDGSLRLDPDGPCSEQAQDILETYPWTYDAPLPGRARSDTLCRRARNALAAGDETQALKLAQRAWRKGKSKDAAWLLGALLPPKKGIGYLRQGLILSGGMPEGYFALADALAHLGRTEEARSALADALPRCDTLRRCEGFCLAAWRSGAEDMALELIEEKLRRMPQSVDYLRLKYLCLMRLGRKDQAGRTLEALLEIDPDDGAGLWYRRHPEGMEMDAAGGALLTALGGMVYAIPERLRRGPLNRLLHLLAMMLAGRADIPLIYRAVPPLWRRLSPAEKRALDERRSPCLTGALAAVVLLLAGKKEEAEGMLSAAPGRKRMLRQMRRLVRLSEEEQEHALRQF